MNGRKKIKLKNTKPNEKWTAYLCNSGGGKTVRLAWISAAEWERTAVASRCGSGGGGGGDEGKTTMIIK